MFINLDTINNINKVANREQSSTREENYKASLEAFETLLATAPTTYLVELKGNDLKRSKKIEACIVRESPERTIKNILYRVNENIITGEYILRDNETYIAYELDRSTVGYKKRDIQLCNNTLTFEDNVSGKIFKFPCIVGDKTSVYADGLAINSLNVISDDMISITVPNNEMIASIPSYGYRLIFNNSVVYSTTRKDMLTNSGLIVFRAIAELKDGRDDFKNNIAYQKAIIEIEEKKDEVEDSTVEKEEPTLKEIPIIDIADEIMYNVKDFVEIDLSKFNSKDYSVKFYENEKIFNDIEVSNKTETQFNFKLLVEKYTTLKMVIEIENEGRTERLIKTRGRF